MDYSFIWSLAAAAAAAHRSRKYLFVKVKTHAATGGGKMVISAEEKTKTHKNKETLADI